MDIKDLENRFAFHPANTDAKQHAHACVRDHCLELASWLNGHLQDSREKSLAITHLEEVMMWSNAAIARNEDVE